MMITFASIHSQPPYSGTIFIDPDIIKSSDPSSIVSTSYTGQGSVTMYDRRVNDWVTVNAYLFNVVWNDGLTSRAQVNPEFGNIGSATIEAEKYAYLIGQLPHVLRVDIKEIWIHMGVQPFGGGNNAILIHTGQSSLYEKDGIIEETLVHEACHSSLDASHAKSSGWINAQNVDNQFISTYARDNPIREDVAESFLPWLAVKFRKDRISAKDYNNITKAIPNRLSYFDSFHFNLYPFENTLNTKDLENQGLKIYPNPVANIIHISGNNIIKEDIRIYNLVGQDFTPLTSYEKSKINVSNLARGYYILKIKTFTAKIYKK